MEDDDDDFELVADIDNDDLCEMIEQLIAALREASPGHVLVDDATKLLADYEAQ